MFAYHVVTERPMHVGQQILFDGEQHSGVYQRVYDKIDIVNDIYANPDKYDAENRCEVSDLVRVKKRTGKQRGEGLPCQTDV